MFVPLNDKSHTFSCLCHGKNDIVGKQVEPVIYVVTLEFQMVGMNARLNSDIEIAFLMADASHQAIASRLVKEIASLNGAIDAFTRPTVAEKLRAKFAKKQQILPHFFAWKFQKIVKITLFRVIQGQK